MHTSFYHAERHIQRVSGALCKKPCAPDAAAAVVAVELVSSDGMPANYGTHRVYYVERILREHSISTTILYSNIVTYMYAILYVSLSVTLGARVCVCRWRQWEQYVLNARPGFVEP